MSVATISTVILDCADPIALSGFYAAVTGWEVESADATWASLKNGPIGMAFQQVEGYTPPVWPGEKHAHLDFSVPDRAAAVSSLLLLGATLPEHQPGGDGWTVLLDPAGHPFCVM